MTAVVIAVELDSPAAQDVGRDELSCSGTAARIDAEKAVAANSVILTRATGTPRLRAALGRAADAGDPVAELASGRGRRRPTTAIRIHQTIDTYRSAVDQVELDRQLQLKKPASGSAVDQRPVDRDERDVGEPRGQDRGQRRAMMNIVASVTMNDGSPVRTTMRPLMHAEDRSSATIEMRIASQIGRPQIVDADADHDPGEADQRADREVELAGDHQQGDRRSRRSRPGRRRRGS